MSGTGADPEAAGFVASLRRPGGNITGLSMLSTELSGKRLELLKEMASSLGRVAVLRNPKFPAVAIQSKETEMAAQFLGLQLQAWEVRGSQEIESAFSSMSKAGTSGLIVFSDPVILERNPRIHYRARAQVPDSDCLSLEDLRRGRWPCELFGEPPRYASPRPRFRRQNSQRHQAR